MASSCSQVETCSSGIPSWVSARQAVLMVCRSWVLSDSWGKQEGKQYILSDYGGFVVQAVVHCDNPSCKLCTLMDGEIYSFADFQLMANNRSIQFRKQGMNTLDVSRCHNVIHLSGPPHGFTRNPINLVALEDIQQSDEKFQIDVMGRVIAVGVSRPTNRGNFIVDCHIMNQRGTNVKLMLWNQAASSLLCYEETNPTNNVCVFTYMDVREYDGNICLSSTAATSVHMAEDIPSVTNELRKYARNGHPTMSAATKDCEQGKDHSLTQILYIGRANSYNKVKEVTTVNCKVKVLQVRKDHPWFSYTCPLRNCQKGVVKAGDVYWCNSCEEISPHAVPSYRLHVEVTDGISTVTVAFLDFLGVSLVQRTIQEVLSELGDCADPYSPPEDLLQFCNRYHVLALSSHTYLDHRSHESFACGGILTHLFNVQLGIVPSPALFKTTAPAAIGDRLLHQATPSGGDNSDE